MKNDPITSPFASAISSLVPSGCPVIAEWVNLLPISSSGKILSDHCLNVVSERHHAETSVPSKKGVNLVLGVRPCALK